MSIVLIIDMAQFGQGMARFKAFDNIYENVSKYYRIFAMMAMACP